MLRDQLEIFKSFIVEQLVQQPRTGTEDRLYVELLLLASMVSAVIASLSQSGKVSRFGLSFYALFSSLVIYGLGEVLPALFYLITLGIGLAALVAFLEERFKTLASNGRSSSITEKLMFASATAIVFVVVFFISRDLVYAVPASIASVGVLTLEKKCLLKTMIGVATLEGAFFVILTRIGFFTVLVSVPLCLFMLVSSLGLPYALYRRK
jgi:hypothetical protein